MKRKHRSMRRKTAPTGGMLEENDSGILVRTSACSSILDSLEIYEQILTAFSVSRT